ncbi:MAG: PAS domain S-box protein [Betaproteobacteria bacterium]
MPDSIGPSFMPKPSWVGRGYWWWPLLASLVFVIGMVAWARSADQDEQTRRRDTLIADALSAEAQLRAQLAYEKSALDQLANHLPAVARNSSALLATPEVTQGLRRMWLGVTWLDAKNRIVAQAPELLPEPVGAGMSSHFSVAVGDERLVVRYAAAQLLRKGAPWWLVRKYELELVDSSEQVLASVDDLPLRPDLPGQESYRVAVDGNLPGSYLELTLREPTPPFWRTLPLVLMGGFLSLMVLATVLLRRQVRHISQAETAWRTEAAWRRAMGDSALVGLRARDAHGRILYVNRTFCDLVGLRADQLIGLAPPMPYWPPEAMEEVMLRHQRNLAGQAPREGYEAVWCHQDGHQLDVMVFESPLIGADGQQSGWMGSIIDITERKRLQQRERQQAQAMAHQARLTMLGEVASALAHQLNQPLTAIVGYNAGLQRLLGQTPGTAHAVLSALEQQGQQAAEAGKIVRRIREFLTRHAPLREPCALDALAERAVQWLQPELSALGINLRWDVAPGLAPVCGDPVLLEQVLINLVRNAADALATGALAPIGGERLICIRVQPHGSEGVLLEVHDNGPGLRGGTVEQICAPFYSTKATGMGMGLAICRSVVEAHGGAMQAGASDWGGARMAFTLAVVKDGAISHLFGQSLDHAGQDQKVSI